MAKRIRRTQIVDAASGEVLNETRETVYTSEYYKPGEGYRLYSRRHTRLGGTWRKPMDIHSWGMLLQIILTMDDNNRMADVPTLAKEFGVSTRRIYQMLAVLKTHGAIKKVSGGYAVNPAVAFAGTYLSPQLYRLFESDLYHVVPKWAKTMYDREEP